MEILYNWFSMIVNIFTRFFTMCKTFFQSIIDFFNGVGNILSTLWFGLKTLTSGIWSLIEQVFDGTLFDYMFSGFNSLAGYIGYGGVIFISSLLFVCMVRIIIGFVFKMFRLNVDYKTMKTKWNK